MTTPLYHASLGAITGLFFRIGETQVFAPVEDERLYILPSAQGLVVKDRLPDDMAQHFTHTHIEPRLWSLERGKP